jgi:hypothetical protein
MKSTQTKERYKSGVMKVTTSPMAQAATPESMDAYKRGIEESISSGRRADALNSASFADWKSNASGIGADRLQTGAMKGKQKLARKAAALCQGFADAQAAAAAIVNDGTGAAISARVLASVNAMKKAAGKPTV